MKKAFDNVLENYLLDHTKEISKSVFYKDFKKTIPDHLKSYLDRNYKIRASTGVGNKTHYPWIGIFNKKITDSAKHGLYIVYLFKRDMTGFYLSLNQGITFFKEQYGRKRLNFASKVSQKFREDIYSDTFSKHPIELISENKMNDLGYGYEHTNIISKYYHKNQYDLEELEADFQELISLYEEIIDKFQVEEISYKKLVESFIKKDITLPSYSKKEIDHADEIINKALSETVDSEEFDLTHVEEVNAPEKKQNKTTYLKSISHHKKIDYIKKTKIDLKTGLLGELLVLKIEENRLKELGREDLAKKIKHISKVDDSKGFDIQSFNLDEKGKEYEVYIEVKATTLENDGNFFISRNELEKSKSLDRRYWIYRVFNLNKKNKKYYVIKSDIENDLTLTPYTYEVKI